MNNAGMGEPRGGTGREAEGIFDPARANELMQRELEMARKERDLTQRRREFAEGAGRIGEMAREAMSVREGEEGEKLGEVMNAQGQIEENVGMIVGGDKSTGVITGGDESAGVITGGDDVQAKEMSEEIISSEGGKKYEEGMVGKLHGALNNKEISPFEMEEEMRRLGQNWRKTVFGHKVGDSNE